MTLHLRATVSSGTPVYRQVADQLLAALESGALQPGDALPAAAALARDLVVHPSAVQRAYDVLRAEGVLEAGDGRHVVDHARRVLPANAAATDLQARQFRDACDVQRALLPEAAPTVAGLDVAALTRPALGVGGDYFDFLTHADGRLTVVCADVSGKGMAAALLMATLRAFVHSHGEADLPLTALVATLNRRLYDSTAPNRFATFCVLRCDAGGRALDYVNAGHEPPVIVRAGGAIERLAAGGPALGVLPEATFHAGRIDLRPGDVVALYSDGLSDALDAAGVEFGEARLVASIGHHAARPARELVRAVIGAVDRFAAGTAQFDDMTLVALRATERPS